MVNSVHVIHVNDDFDLRRIADSGQCFRWTHIAENKYLIIHLGVIFTIEKLDADEYLAKSNVPVPYEFYETYFDLRTNYRYIRNKITEFSDDFMYNACKKESGIRILKQDAWEVLISFIISQRKSIPSIKKSIEKLCELAGHKIICQNGYVGYSFPSCYDIMKLTDKQLESCGLGYRVPYIKSAAALVCSGNIDLRALGRKEDEACIETLKIIHGVGDKVANCVALYGFHKLNAFPVDVWIQRVIDAEYSGVFPKRKFTPYCGVYQQYMYAYARTIGIYK